jgi:hypothetical protein
MKAIREHFKEVAVFFREIFRQVFQIIILRVFEVIPVLFRNLVLARAKGKNKVIRAKLRI